MATQVTTSKVFTAIQKADAKVLVLQGSTRSTKTYSIIQYLISCAIANEKAYKKQKLRFAVIRQKLTWLRSSVLKDFETIMRDQFGIWDENAMNKSEWTYTLGHTEFSFTGLDHEAGQKFHGVGYDKVWFNECNEIDYPSVRQIMLRLKGQAIFDYNPNIDAKHWIETKIKTREDVWINHSTYKDNPFLEESIVAEIESYKPTPENIERGTADEQFWKIYGLGERATLKGLIFPNFETVTAMPKEDKDYKTFGLDFGFTNDPTAMVRIVIIDRSLFIEEYIYETGLTNIDNPKQPSQPSIEKRFAENGITRYDRISADSAEPKAIQDLCNCGYNVKGVKKGAGSIMAGIMTIKNYKVHIVESSMNLIDEFRKYRYKENPRTEEPVNTPIDRYNHAIDALRYGLFGAEDNIQMGNYAFDSARYKFNFSNYGGL